MIASYLIQCEPDKIFIDVGLGLRPQRVCDLRRRAASVTFFPDRGHGKVEAMRRVSIHVVDEHFVLHLLNDNSLGARLGLCDCLRSHLGLSQSCQRPPGQYTPVRNGPFCVQLAGKLTVDLQRSGRQSVKSRCAHPETKSQPRKGGWSVYSWENSPK